MRNFSKIRFHCFCNLFNFPRNFPKNSYALRSSLCYNRRLYSSGKIPEDDNDTTPLESINDLRTLKFFKDTDSPIILDVEEERRLLLNNPELLEEIEEDKNKQFFGLNLERGENGVFEVDELVSLLRNDNASNVVTIAIPSEYRYADYMIIVSGKSFKHLYSMAEFVKKLFKKKRYETDRVPKIEGIDGKVKDTTGWLAMDLGNIVLHLFLEPVRRKYDLETLWAVGKEYDDLYNMKDDSYVSLLQQHTILSLDDLVPLDDSSKSSTEDQQKLA